MKLAIYFADYDFEEWNKMAEIMGCWQFSKNENILSELVAKNLFEKCDWWKFRGHIIFG